MQDKTLDIHIRAAGRPGVETERLLDDLTAYCWPGGTADRTNPVFRGWLRHFAPIGPITSPSECTCALGHCTSCN